MLFQRLKYWTGYNCPLPMLWLLTLELANSHTFLLNLAWLWNARSVFLRSYVYDGLFFSKISSSRSGISLMSQLSYKFAHGQSYHVTIALPIFLSVKGQQAQPDSFDWTLFMSLRPNGKRQALLHNTLAAWTSVVAWLERHSLVPPCPAVSSPVTIVLPLFSGWQVCF